MVASFLDRLCLSAPRNRCSISPAKTETAKTVVTWVKSRRFTTNLQLLTGFGLVCGLEWKVIRFWKLFSCKMQLYKRLCPLVRRPVHPSIGRVSVGQVKLNKFRNIQVNSRKFAAFCNYWPGVGLVVKNLISVSDGQTDRSTNWPIN